MWRFYHDAARAFSWSVGVGGGRSFVQLHKQAKVVDRKNHVVQYGGRFTKTPETKSDARRTAARYRRAGHADAIEVALPS
jgi:hypothetical protein